MKITKTVQRDEGRFLGSSYGASAYSVDRLNLALLGDMDASLERLFKEGLVKEDEGTSKYDEPMARRFIHTLNSEPTPSLLYSAEVVEALGLFSGKALLIVEDLLGSNVEHMETSLDTSKGYNLGQVHGINLQAAEARVRAIRGEYQGPIVYGFKAFETHPPTKKTTYPVGIDPYTYIDDELLRRFEDKFTRVIDGSHLRERETELAYLESRPELLVGQKLYKDRADGLMQGGGDIYHKPRVSVRVLTPLEKGSRFLPVLQFGL